MKNNIYCTFDLSKSVSHFQEKVTKILELTNIPEWNGQTFKLREKEIRESALILAGECIAFSCNFKEKVKNKWELKGIDRIYVIYQKKNFIVQSKVVKI